MKNNMLVFWLKVIVGGMVVIAGLVNLIRGIATNELWAITCTASLLIIAGGLAWIMKPGKKRIDEKLNDPVYVELRSFLRETLLPAGFKEDQEDGGPGFAATYSLGELSVRLGKDLRDNEYFFGVASQSNFVEVNGESINSPKYDFENLDGHDGDGEGFKARVQKKLTAWLASKTGMEHGH